MLEGIPKLSIMVITYNQEKVVGRTMDSLIQQRDYVYEICVSDDCSTDRTWEILQEYKNRYPDLIKIHRQEHNVGIFENTEYQWTMPTGDMVNGIAGDDTTPNGWYKSVIEFILKNNIDWRNELFCIYGDYQAVYPNGDSIVFSHKAIKRWPNEALRLALRGLIVGRGCCFSKKILDKFEHVSQGRSHIVEFVQDRQIQIYAEKNYYIPQLSNIYYANIGVSSHINAEERKERQQIREYTVKYLESKGIKLYKTDKYQGKYKATAIQLRNDKKLKTLFLLILYKILGFNIKYMGLGSDGRHLLFALRRRLPHKNPIHF